jgi:predicted transcriptional regulator of viral defense system
VRPNDFYEVHPVFSHAEFVTAHTAEGRSPSTSNNLLANHLASGRLIRIQRGLYATVPRGVKPSEIAIDPYLVASKLENDAIVAYHAALQFFGKAYSIWRRFHYLTAKRARPFSFQSLEFVPVNGHSQLHSRAGGTEGVSDVRHAGGLVRVTTLERTLVDLLDQPDKGGRWEEIWRSLEMVEFFDLDSVISHAKAIGSAVTAARVGFFLEQHHEALMLEEKHLKEFERLAPKQPRYLDSARQSGRLVKRWNLVVPEYVLNRQWEEAAG